MRFAARKGPASQRPRFKPAFRVFGRDVSRLVRNPVAVVVVLGACLMPSLYAWYCIAANWDPYQNTDVIKVAVANLDEGAYIDPPLVAESANATSDQSDREGAATGEGGAAAGLSEGSYTNIGDQVVARLHENDQLNWQFVSEEEAIAGVESGEYYAAIVIPHRFSEDFASVLSGSREHPRLEYYVNEKTSAVIPKITDIGISTLEEQIDREFAGTVGESVAQTMRNLGADVQSQSQSSSASLESSLLQARELTSQIRLALDNLNRAARSAANPAQGSVASIESLVNQAESLADATDAAFQSLDAGLAAALDDIRVLQSSATARDIALLAKTDPAQVAQLMAQPIRLETHVKYPVRNYGSGVTPFYVSLALWVTGFILAAILHTRLRQTEPPITRLSYAQAYFSRLLLFLTLALVSAASICLGCLAMGIQCESPAAFVAAGFVTVIVDVSIIYALVQAFRHIGRALAVVVLIVQVPGSAGMYPIEMMPTFYQVVHPLLPFTYSIDALREAIAGLNVQAYLADLACLLFFVPASLAIGLGLGKRLHERGLSFERKLAQAELFECEPELDVAAHEDEPRR